MNLFQFTSFGWWFKPHQTGCMHRSIRTVWSNILVGFRSWKSSFLKSGHKVFSNLQLFCFILCALFQKHYSMPFDPLTSIFLELHFFRHSSVKEFLSRNLESDFIFCRLEIGRQETRSEEVCDHCSTTHFQLGPSFSTFFRLSLQDKDLLAREGLSLQSPLSWIF